MATNFPASLDNLSNPNTTDRLNNPSHAIQHANENDAIEALQAKVGIDGSSVVTSHDYKIAQLQAAISAGSAGTKLIYQDVRNQSGSNLAKATPVYVTGSEGASGKLLISAASNASEATSSKTMGLTSSAITNNNNGQVVTEGILENVDTTGAADGDPVWLGVNGAKIYGLANKPAAPAHLVFLGIVVRGGQANTGSIYVKVQNGFELHELHNVSVTSLANKDALVYDSTTQLWKNYDLTQDFVSSSDVQNSLGDYIPLNVLGQADGVASLDATGKIPDTQIPAGIARDSEVATAIANLVNSAPSTLDTLNELATALGNDANFSTTITNALAAKAPINSPTFTGIVGGITKTMVGLGSVDNTSDLNKPISTATQSALDGKVSKSGGSLITPSSSTTAGLSFTPASGQTANLLEFIGGPAGGGVKVGPGGNIFDAPAINANYSFVATAGGSGVVPSIIKGAASQTADLTQWQNSAGEVQVSIKPTANLTNVLKFTEQYSFAINWGTQPILSTYTGNLVISPYGPERNPLIVKGLSSQTGDLQQWQNSSGTVLSQIYASGNARFSSGTASGEFKIVSDLGNSSWFGVYNSNTAKYYGISAQLPSPSGTITLGGYYDGVGVGGATHNTNSPIFAVVTSTNAAPTTAPVVTFDTGETRLRAQSAGYTPLKVIAAASQTANLQEWQDSSGNVRAFVNASGDIGTVYGSLQVGNGNAIKDSLATTPNITFGNNTITVWTRNSTYKGFIIQGVASQTANLQEWQNSAGTVMAKISSSGDIYAVSRSVLSRFVQADNGAGAYIDLGFNNANSVSIVGRTSTTAPQLIIKGINSQTANLQEWQNNSGTVLAKITSTGAFDATAITVNGSPISGGLTPFSISSNTGLSSNSKYFVNTSAARTLTLPASPSVGDEIQVFDASNLAGTNNVTISSNGGKINGSVQDAIVDVNGGAMVLIYTGSTYGWRAG